MCSIDVISLKAKVFLVGMLMPLALSASNEPLSLGGDSLTVPKDDLRKNGFVQLAADLTLQNPYGYSFKDVIPNGYHFGLDAAVGRWFSQDIGLKAKVNWGNSIPFLENKKLNWLAPFNQPGVNMDKGGYLSVVGDIMVNLHSLFGGYRPERVWNMTGFVRAGGVYNYGTEKGAPLIGFGVGSTFRLNDHWNLYVEAACNAVSSGFSMDPTTATGTGSGSNRYFDVDFGVTYNIGGTNFAEAGAAMKRGGRFWKNWFVQFGTDMTLYNLCEQDFSKCMTKGRSMGLSGAVGKWFTPAIGLRARLNLENFLIANKKLEWLPYDAELHENNYDGGGCALATGEVLISVKHLFMDYKKGEKWNLYGLGRFGLGSNRSIDSYSPIVGIGAGGTYRFKKIWSAFAETVYQGITSEYFTDISWSGPTGTRFNAIWDFSAGIQLDLSAFDF